MCFQERQLEQLRTRLGIVASFGTAMPTSIEANRHAYATGAQDLKGPTPSTQSKDNLGPELHIGTHVETEYVIAIRSQPQSENPQSLTQTLP